MQANKLSRHGIDVHNRKIDATTNCCSSNTGLGLLRTIVILILKLRTRAKRLTCECGYRNVGYAYARYIYKNLCETVCTVEFRMSRSLQLY